MRYSLYYSRMNDPNCKPCVKEGELVELHCDFDKIDKKLDAVLEGQSEMRSQFAVANERHEQTQKCLERFGNRLDETDHRVRVLENQVIVNTVNRSGWQTWMEKIGFLALLGLAGWIVMIGGDKFNK